MDYRADKVLADGVQVGISTGRIHSYSYGTMISLGFVNPAYATEGTELSVIWGTPDTQQIEVKVRVAQYPYNKDLVRNEDRDVSDVPTLGHGRHAQQTEEGAANLGDFWRLPRRTA